MEKTDGQSPDVLLFKIGDDGKDLVWLHLDQDVAVFIQSLIDLPSQVSRNQGLRHFCVEVIEIVAKLPANLQYVPKPLGRKEGCFGTLSLYDGVRGHRRPVDGSNNPLRGDFGLLEHPFKNSDDAL